MQDQPRTPALSWLVVFTAGAFFFYSFIQMTLFSTEAMRIEDAAALVPSAPGLGVAVDRAALQTFRVSEVEIR